MPCIFDPRLLVPATVTVLSGLLAASLGSGPSSAASNDDAMQVVADAVMIDAECRAINTMFGQVFHYGEEHGIRAVDIMPLGRRRTEFEAAFGRRVSGTPVEEICGSLQARYAQAFPDWFGPR